MVDVFRKLKKEIEELRSESTDQIFSITEELHSVERVLRETERQHEYTIWYCAFIMSHPAPSDYEKQLSDYIVDMYKQSAPDLEENIKMWQKRVTTLQQKLVVAKDIQKQLDGITLTVKPAAK